VTYAGEHGPDEVGPVNWVLHREWVLAREVHPLGVRRAETTKIAIEDLQAPSNHLRWALGIAAGALLAAGAFVASPLNGTNDGANSAGSVPEHTFASLEQRLSVTAPAADAPPAQVPAPTPVNEQPPQETAPASPQPQADAVAQHPVAGGGANQQTAPSANTPAPAPAPTPAPAPSQQWGSGGQWGSGPQWGYGSQWGSGSQWGYGQWGYGMQQQSPVNGFGAPTPSSYSAATSTPTGPAMSMLDPFCTMGR
jgi:outer membrane biosynthesis protein TonB